MMSRRETHPTADLFPALDAVTYEQLKADIEKNGQLEPIWLDKDGKIIDGRHRYQACLDLKIEPDFHERGLRRRPRPMQAAGTDG